MDENKVFKSKPSDMDAYVRRISGDTCFICEIVAGNREYWHHVIYEDDQAIVFLNKYPTLYGYTLVCPKEHREQVTGDFTIPEYLELQKLIYSVSEAVRQVVSAERLYILSLGSRQGNSHVHWHIAPLPPGVPFHEQQLTALHVSDKVLDIPDAEMVILAQKIRVALLSLLSND